VTQPTDPLVLVDLHVGSLHELDARGRLCGVRENVVRVPVRMALVLTARGHRVLLRNDVPDDIAAAIEERVAAEPVGALRQRPDGVDDYRAILGAMAPVETEYCGPAFVLPDRADADRGRAIELGPAERPMLARHYAGWEADFEGSSPLAGVIEDGAVVSVCGCARLLAPAVEAGVDTVEAWRGRGYARHAVTVWAAALRARDVVPLYSTWWGNAASQRVAAALGAVQYGVDFSLT